MGIIKQMPDHLANQIAAGEVVERPASVVKELVENAIDAKSTNVLIELVEAGIQSIRISDDGIGMEESDIKMSILPHATSKIYDIHDLFQIQSLGFRGEALASIASVSKMTIQSTPNQSDLKSDQGYFIKVHGSQIIEEGVTPPRLGTVMTVESLFYNTPARLKHLSSLKTELKHILNFVQQISLAYPQIRFKLISDNSEIFSSYGTGELRQTIANVYQPIVARQLLPIQAEDDDFIISGYISPPQLTRTSKQYIHWLINGRVIQSYVLSQMLLKAYGRQLMIGRFPIVIINIELDPQLVDVNVHPTKQTVRLSKETELSHLLVEAVTTALQRVNAVPQVQAEDIRTNRLERVEPRKAETLPFDLTSAPTTESNSPISNLEIKADPDYQNRHNDVLKNNLIEETVSGFGIEEATDEASTESLVEVQREFSVEEFSELEFQTTSSIFMDEAKVPFYDLRYVGQIHGTYLVAESDQGFYLIDQHAAQERLRYERLMKAERIDHDQQHLLLPFVFQFSPSESMVVEGLSSKLEDLGIYLSSFGPNTYQMDSYPNWMQEGQVEKTVHDLIVLLQENPNLTINQLQEKSIIMQSCRGAIKANQYLSPEQAIALIRDMADLDDPYHCPHGRPVFVEFNQTTLEKLFKRIQDSHQGGHQL